MAENNNQPNQKYIDEYIKNEIDANKQMAFANLVAAITLLIIWILYIFKLFPLHQNIYLLVNILFPINILILSSPMFYLKTKKIEKPGFKYFAIFSFVAVVFLVNVLIPKHAVLGWALCIAMVNHYYNQKLGRMVFITVLILLFIALYAGLFLGEYDPYLLSDGIYDGKVAYEMDPNGNYYYPDSPKERFEVLQKLLSWGENRYLKIFIFYYLPRTIFLSLIFVVSNSLNKRTYNLLINEIKVNSEQQKVSTELKVAKEIQLNTLPSEFASNKDAEVMAELKAAKEVGGDFYDYIKLNDDYVAVVIGDVSGKGIPAAMFMMKTITCFKNYISKDKKPSQILKEVNRTIYEGNYNQMFVTCFLGILDTKTGLLRFSNAGHNPPIVGQNRKFHYLKCNPGFILGGMPDAYVVDEEITLEKGDVLFLYTDGVTEARNQKGEFYGEERLIKFFNCRDYSSIVHLHHELKDDVAVFVGDAEQSDDMTFLTIKYRGDEYYYTEKIFDGTFDAITDILDYMEKFCGDYSIPRSLTNNILVVGDELISNIVKYGYKEVKGSIFLRLLYNVSQKELTITVIDTAPEFNPFEVNNGPISGDIANREAGGLGIFMVKNIMSEYAYDRVNNKNIVTLKKKL